MAKNRQGVSYDDIVSLTASFTSVDGLRDALIEREIEQQQAGGSSVHGLINFLKREMHFSSDPYSAWYSIDGSRRSASFQDLMELKDVRNSLIHDAGRPAAAFFKKYPGVPRSGAHIRINADYYRRFRLVLVSIAHSIAHSISTGAYNPEGWANGSERAATD